MLFCPFLLSSYLPLPLAPNIKKRRKSCLKCACLSAHTWGEGGSQVSSHMLSTSFTNKRIDGKIPGEHFTGVKLKKSSCTRIASVRRTKQLPRDLSLNSPHGTTCGKESERFQQKAKPGPFAWQLQMEPVWGTQPAKNNNVQTAISSAASFSLSQTRLEFVPTTETWETEKCFL